ncbi:hypothetical protein SprV_0200673200 [Sparganum proliferum]
MRPPRNADAQPSPTCPQRQRASQARIGLTGHLRISCASPTAPTAVPPPASFSPPPPPPTNCDCSSGSPLPSFSSSSSSSVAPTTAALAAVAHINTTHNLDTTDTTFTTSYFRGEDQDCTSPHCDRIFNSRIGLVGHLRIHRTETGEAVPGASIYTHRTRFHRPHWPRTFRHRMGPFGHMRIHECGTDRNPDTPTTSNTSAILSTTLASSPCEPITTTTTASSVADTDTADFSCLHCPRKFTSRIDLAKPNRYSPREVRHLNYISQFTADIRYVRGSDNVVANELSRPDINTLTSDFDLAKLADLQSGEKFIDDLRSTTTLQLRDAPLPASPGTILCDWSTGTPRPVVPLSYRKTVFDHFHSLSYPAIRASRKLIAARFIWPKMNSDIVFWIRQCLSCQKNKVHRHTFSPPSTFAVPDVRFHHVHLDLVGPPPPSRGYTHILTAVDRFTPWPIAVPISDTSAENTVMVFLTQWISTFGVPATLTTDRGSQFQSSLFREFTRLLACAHITTTAYHPASNGLVERLHRQLKSALMSQTESATWSVNPPLMLLGIRSSVREDIQCTAAELVYGTPLRLPGEFVQSSTTTTYIPSTFVQQLKQRMAQLRPTPTRLTSKRVFVHKDLKSVPFVFARHEAVRKFLCPSYDGPYEVLQRMDKCYVIQKAERNDTVSIDRLKSAYLECIPLSVVPPISSAPSPPDPPVSVPSTAPHTSSRSGRHIYFPAKLKGFSL